LPAIDETTLLVPISQVLFRSFLHRGLRAPLLSGLTASGAHVILDVFQAAGTIL